MCVSNTLWIEDEYHLRWNLIKLSFRGSNIAIQLFYICLPVMLNIYGSVYFRKRIYNICSVDISLLIYDLLIQSSNWNWKCGFISWHFVWKTYHIFFSALWSDRWGSWKKVKEFFFSVSHFPSLLKEWNHWGIVRTATKVIASPRASFVTRYCVSLMVNQFNGM